MIKLRCFIMSFFKNVNELKIGESVYHFIFGKGSFEGIFTKEKRNYFEVNFGNGARKIFSTDMYGKIISNDPLNILEMIFDNLDNRMQLSDIYYINPIKNIHENECNPIARKQSIYPIFNFMFLPKEELFNCILYNDGFLKFREKYTDYSLVPIEIEPILAANNFMSVSFDNYSYCFFPILQKWIYLDDVIEMIEKDEEVSSYFPSIMQRYIITRVPKLEWKRNTRYFWGKELAIHSSFYSLIDNRFPNYFLENIEQYTDTEKKKIKCCAERLIDYQKGLESIMNEYKADGIILNHNNSSLIEDYDHEVVIKQIVSDKYKKILEEIVRKIDDNYYPGNNAVQDDLLLDNPWMSKDKAELALYNASRRYPFFARYSLSGGIQNGNYLTRFEEYVNPEHQIFLWSSDEAKDYYYKNKKVRFYGFSFNDENLIERVIDSQNDFKASRILMLKEKEQIFDIIETMDENQYKIVTEKPQNMIVEGKAGTGKTAVLQTRIAYCLARKMFCEEDMILISNSSQLIRDTKYILSGIGLNKFNEKNITSAQEFLASILVDKIRITKTNEWLENANLEVIYSNENNDKYLEIIKTVLDFSNDELKDDVKKLIIDYKKENFLSKIAEELLQKYENACEILKLNQNKDADSIIKLLNSNVIFKNVKEYFEVLKKQVSLERARKVIDYPTIYMQGDGDEGIRKKEAIRQFNVNGLFYFLINVLANNNAYKSLFATRALIKGEEYFNEKHEIRKITSEKAASNPLIYPVRNIEKKLGDNKENIKLLTDLYYAYYQYTTIKKEIDKIKFVDIIEFYKRKFDWNALCLFNLVLQLNKKSPIEINNKIQTVYIDEYENLPAELISFLRHIYTKANFELYGDYTQKIGNHSLFKDESFEKYTLLINYRSSISLLEYLKETFGINYNKDELPYHPKFGQVKKISLKEYMEEPSVSLFSSHRFAVICKRKYLEKVRKLLLEKYYDKDIVELDKNEKITQRKISLCSVEMVAGLEFEEVFVFEKDMSYFEKYVAESRALEDLTIIKE